MRRVTPARNRERLLSVGDLERSRPLPERRVFTAEALRPGAQPVRHSDKYTPCPPGVKYLFHTLTPADPTLGLALGLALGL